MSKLNTNRFFRLTAALALVVVLASSCVKDEDSAGYEYMPDMYRSPAVEAYVDYGLVGDNEVDSLKEMQSARIPADGSIPYTANKEDAKINMPYPYPNTTDGYEQAGAELTNPLKPTEENLAEGKRIYSFMCQHCHGEKGKGDGAVVTKGGHAPPSAYDGPLKDLPVGKMFHTITYGKGVMGSHASQLSKKERWQVILHVQALQNGGEFPVDSNAINVLQLEAGPVGTVVQPQLPEGVEAPDHGDGTGHNE